MIQRLVHIATLVAGMALPLALGGENATSLLVRPDRSTTIERIAARHGLVIQRRMDAIRWYQLGLPSGLSMLRTLDRLRRDPQVALVERNGPIESPETDQIIHAFIDGSPTTTEYVDQDAFARIKGPEAWPYVTGAPSLVAVLDTGVDLDHPGLAGHISDGGWDFVADDPVPDDDQDGIDEDGDGEVDEGAGHGTHIAGIITLVHPNAIILAVRVLNSDGTGDVGQVASGVIYAVQAGAPVINLSLGLTADSQALRDAVAYAVHLGAAVVASAGNRRTDQPQYPAAYPGVISVAATDRESLKADFSNFGAWVAIAAPGVDIYSTFANGQYAVWSGTSFSTAFVSGQVALLLSVDTTLAPQQTLPYITGTAENEDPRYALGAGEVVMRDAARQAAGGDD
ncbi:MAG: S8 family serine peptidase [Planctomycetota bacterium]